MVDKNYRVELDDVRNVFWDLAEVVAKRLDEFEAQDQGLESSNDRWVKRFKGEGNDDIADSRLRLRAEHITRDIIETLSQDQSAQGG